MIHVTCALIFKDDLILCAQRSATMKTPLKWEFPGGKIEAGESEEECLMREIREELNIAIRILEKWPEVIHSFGENKQLRLIPFTAEVISGTPIATEHAELRWVERRQLHLLDWADADLPIVKRIQNSI